MTALTILTKATARLGLPIPAAVFSSTDDQVIQLRNLLNLEGQELAKGGAETDHAWTNLVNECVFVSQAAPIQSGIIPTDFGWFINDTMWNRTTLIRAHGPVSAEEWQRLQAIALVSLPNVFFRFRGINTGNPAPAGILMLYPTPPAGQTFAFEYVSQNWAKSAAGTALSEMTADSDVGILDETLLTLGVIWRFLKAKGFDYSEDYRTYTIAVGKAVARDGARARRYLSGPPQRLWSGNIKEGSWP